MKVLRDWATPAARGLVAAARLTEADVDELVAGRKYPEAVEARRLAFVALADAGMTHQQIADLVQPYADRSSVSYVIRCAREREQLSPTFAARARLVRAEVARHLEAVAA